MTLLERLYKAIIEKDTNKKFHQRCEQKGILVHYCQKLESGKPLWKKMVRFLEILNIELPLDPSPTQMESIIHQTL